MVTKDQSTPRPPAPPDRGGQMLELAVVFGIVAVIAVMVLGLVSSTVGPQIRDYIGDQVSQALNGDGGGAEAPPDAE